MDEDYTHSKINMYIAKYLKMYVYPFDENTTDILNDIAHTLYTDDTPLHNSRLFKRALRILMRNHYAQAIVNSGIKIASQSYNNI